MSHEDILDNMSLSDDEMLDNLADDMLMEIENDEEADIPTISTASGSHGTPTPSTPAFPFGAVGAPRGGPNAMPDLSQMMSQMMPMMSQMFGGGQMGGMRGPNGTAKLELAWDEIIKQHVPANEQKEWLTTIEKDTQVQANDASTKRYVKPPSRSYHGAVKSLPTIYIHSDTLLANLLNESVREAHVEHNPKWKEERENLVTDIAESGLVDIFVRELKNQLRQRVEQDHDYQTIRANDPTRFQAIAKALQV